MVGLEDRVCDKILQDDSYAIACMITLSKKTEEIDPKDIGCFLEVTAEYRNKRKVDATLLKRGKRKAVRYIPQLLRRATAPRSQAKSNTNSIQRLATPFGKYIRLDFPNKEHLVNRVKYMGKVQRMRHAGEWCWRVGRSIKNILILKDMKFEIDPEIQTWYDKTLENLKGQKSNYTPFTQDELQLNLPLLPYQLEGVGFIESRQGRALLGDEMGLGKTVQAIAWSHFTPIENKRILVFCPASVKLGWAKEYRKWIGKSPSVLFGRTPMLLTSNENIVVINYEIASGWKDILLDYSADIVIIDECHRIKNPKAKTTEAVKEVAEKASHIIGLSGTPITSRPDEFHTFLKLLEPSHYSNYWEYAQAYCGARYNGFAWESVGASNLDILHLEVSRVMIRRKKKDVLQDLPEKQHHVVPIEFNKAIYEKSQKEFDEWIEEGDTEDQVKGFGAVEKLKQACLDAKMPSVIDWVDTFLESGEKIGLFTTHVKTIKVLKEHYKDKMLYIDGSTPSAKRQAIVQQFASDDSKTVFVGNMKAAGTGIDGLQDACSNVVFIELGWTPGDHDQAEDRFHRIGQKNQVAVWYLIAEGTIESDIMFVLDQKRSVIDAVLDGKTTERKNYFLSALIKRYKKEKKNV